MISATTALRSASGSGGAGLLGSLFSVAGKNVLVTGGSRGIGLMIAKNFTAAGANVLLTSRSEDACREASEAIAGTISASGSGAPAPMYVASNVSSRKGCEELADHAARVFGERGLDVLVNNAGASWGEPLDRTSGRANWGFDKVLDLVRTERRKREQAKRIATRCVAATMWTRAFFARGS